MCEYRHVDQPRTETLTCPCPDVDNLLRKLANVREEEPPILRGEKESAIWAPPKRPHALDLEYQGNTINSSVRTCSMSSRCCSLTSFGKGYWPLLKL